MRKLGTFGILLVFLAVPWPTPASLYPPELLVVNQTGHSVSFIDPAHPQPPVSFDEAAVTGHEIAVTPDGRTAFVLIYGDSGVKNVSTL
jgi:hypothetical protein